MSSTGKCELVKQLVRDYGYDRQYVLDNMLYVVEFMPDNHAALCERLGVPVTHKHYVCADATAYDYSFGEPVGLEVFF